MTRTLLQPRCVGLALGLALVLACGPSSVEAGRVSSLASDATELTPRQAREAEVVRLLSEEKVARALASVGLTPEQAKERVAQLSDEELERLAQNLEQVQAGKGTGLVLALLAVVLLGILIYMQIEAA